MTTSLTTRLRALGIEPGEAACDYELRAQESNLIPRLSCDAALAELVTALEEASRGYRYYSMCQDKHEQIGWHPDDWEECPVCRMRSRAEQAEADLMFRTEQRDDILKRLEQAEAERDQARRDIAAVIRASIADESVGFSFLDGDGGIVSGMAVPCDLHDHCLRYEEEVKP